MSTSSGRAMRRVRPGNARPRAFCIMSRLVNLSSKVKRQASRSESESEQGVELDGLDAKLSDLPLARVNHA